MAAGHAKPASDIACPGSRVGGSVDTVDGSAAWPHAAVYGDDMVNGRSRCGLDGKRCPGADPRETTLTIPAGTTPTRISGELETLVTTPRFAPAGRGPRFGWYRRGQVDT